MNKPRQTKRKPGDIGIELRSKPSSDAKPPVNPLQHKKQLVADFIRLVAEPANPNGRPRTKSPAGKRSQPAIVMPSLSPRMRQTLDRLLAGDSEKQIAQRLGVSKHTVHVYVKALYRGFEVCSRGELLAKFVQRPSGPEQSS